MSYITMIKASCGGNDNTSSKRVVMYHFLYAALFMIIVQAIFTGISIYKWANLEILEGAYPKFEIHSVFPDIIWYCVFGVITGLAGINGIQNGFGKQAPKLNQQIDEPIPTENTIN